MATSKAPATDPVDVGSFCRSFADRAELDAFEVVDSGAEINAILRNVDPGGTLDAKQKAAIIEAVRGGKHAELKVRATTFRQKDGNPNKNFLRFKSSQLGAIASSFVGKPFLLDHVKYAQSYRKGTILASEGAPLAGGWFGFRQQLHVVKPDAVISVLDGTIDRFSIGWDPRGAVICTAHNVDVRSRKSCYWTENCYPGKLVEVDGEKKIAEYEWQTTEGLEVSGVNSPAVSGTRIENVSQLAAELGLVRQNPHKDRPMKRFTLLFAALAVPAKRQTELSAIDDDAILDAALAELVGETRSELAAANEEKKAAITRAELAEKDAALVPALRAQVTELEGDKVNALLEAKGYKAGKLIRAKDKDGKDLPSPREVRLRRIAKEPGGLAALEAELAELDVVVPVGRQILSEDDPSPRPPAVAGEIPGKVLGSVASQLGLKEDELVDHHNLLAGRDSGGSNN